MMGDLIELPPRPFAAVAAYLNHTEIPIPRFIELPEDESESPA